MLEPFTGRSDVRLWIHLERTTELEVLPWEALGSATQRHVELRGWQVLRAAERRPDRGRGGQLAKALLFVGDVTQERNVRDAAVEAHNTIREVYRILDTVKARVALGVARPTYAAYERLWEDLAAQKLGSALEVATFLRNHRDADMLLAIGHAPEARDALGSDALQIDGNRELLRVTPLPGTDVSLVNALAGSNVRLAAIFGCETGARMASTLVPVVDHVVGLRTKIGPAFVLRAAPVLFESLTRSDSVGAALARVRRTIGELGVHQDHSGSIAPLWWSPAHWTGSLEDLPFLDELGRALREFVARQLERLAALEGDFRGRALARATVILNVDERSGLALGVDGAGPSGSARATVLDLVSELRDRDWRARSGAWLLHGEPGGGKTTSLRMAARELCDGTRGLTPVYVPLASLFRSGEFAARRAKPGSKALECLLWQVDAATIEALEREHERGRLVLLLDGLDETHAERGSFESLVIRLRHELKQAALIVSARSGGATGALESFRPVRLELLDPDQQRALLGLVYDLQASPAESKRRAEELLAWLGQSSYSLQELARRPLFLILLARMHAQVDSSSLSLRHAFLSAAVTYFLEGRYKPEEHRSPSPPEGGAGTPDGRYVLARLALAMTERPEHRWDHAALCAWLENSPPVVREKLAPWLNVRNYVECLRRTGLLGPEVGAGDAWVFFHGAFREALAAEALFAEVMEKGKLAPLSQRLKNVVRRSNRDGAKSAEAWREPFALVSGHLSGKPREEWLRSLLRLGSTGEVALAALATSDAVEPELIFEALERCSDWRDSQLVYGLLGKRFGAAGGMLDKLAERGWRLTRELRDATKSSVRFELLFLLEALEAVGQRIPRLRQRVEELTGAILDKLAPRAGWDGREAFQIPGLDGLLQELPPGRFRMGSPHEELGRRRDEGPVEVALPRAHLARVPVTLAQYRLMDPLKTHFWGEDGSLPVTEVSWFEAKLFCRWMDRHGPAFLGAGWTFRLPTEAEWEYACRGAVGQALRFGSGDGEADLARVAVYGRGRLGPARVASRGALATGLYDLHGNVWEWCENWYEAELGGGPDPAGPPHGTLRAIRGGAFWSAPEDCRAAARNGLRPDVANATCGFRLAAAPSGRR